MARKRWTLRIRSAALRYAEWPYRCDNTSVGTDSDDNPCYLHRDRRRSRFCGSYGVRGHIYEQHLKARRRLLYRGASTEGSLTLESSHLATALSRVGGRPLDWTPGQTRVCSWRSLYIVFPLRVGSPGSSRCPEIPCGSGYNISAAQDYNCIIAHRDCVDEHFNRTSMCVGHIAADVDRYRV